MAPTTRQTTTPEYVVSGGTYYITNAKGGTVIDLSGTDNHSIIGWPYHNGLNQQWKLTWVGAIGWTFQNVATNLYLGVQSGTLTNGTLLVGVNQPTGWDIWHDSVDPTTYRIFVPGAKPPGLNLDLANYGVSTPGDPIQLWEQWSGNHQTWQFHKA